MKQIRRLKFRTFSSKEKEGFIIFTTGPQLPLLILQDILFQLFQPLFSHILSPQIYFFSSTDEILKIQQIQKVTDFIYVHFLQRIDKYKRQQTVQKKFKIGIIQKLQKGIGIQGTNLYIFSEKQYMMYAKDIFLRNTLESIELLSKKHKRKQLIYDQYIEQLQALKDNVQMISLKDQLIKKVEEYNAKVQNIELIYSRFLKVRNTLKNILDMSGISIQSLQDLS